MKCNIIIAKYTRIIAKHIKKHKKLNLMLDKKLSICYNLFINKSGE